MLKPDKATLEHKYLVLLQSTVVLGREYRCDPRQITFWLDDYDIPRRSREVARALSMQQRRQTESQLRSHNEALGGNYNDPLGEIVVQQLLPQDATLTLNEDEPVTAYSQLNRNQQQCIDLMANIDNVLMLKEIAEIIGVVPQTVIAYKTLPLFQRALDEAQRPLFISELKTLSRSDLIKRYRTGVGLTAPDREMAYKITGDIGPDSLVTTQINVGIKGGNLW